MQVRHCENKHIATHITGPKHNYLAITFADVTSAIAEPVLSALPPVGQCKHPPLSSAAISEAVQRGIAAANSETGASDRAILIEYVENDTGPESIFEYLAKAITLETRRHLAAPDKG
jgi:hypothetical protein